MRKVICVICGGIFKVEEPPPLEIMDRGWAGSDGSQLDPYALSALRLDGSIASVDYSQQKCAYCRPEQPGGPV